ncbi:DivIVA domain-containing protein [Kribbella solani]|uniref:DivIVA domain-containing protein n=1 Tax=Kribbella solani TaxID=236067 RepID=UPI0029A3FFB6|nr:DivIVA domain-containing protein [Kribbella solani]MDX3004702.1 DivIVA domain-containing protein [Kribbella solani]
MTNTRRRHGIPQYQTPDQIRGEQFRRRLRGLDPTEVFAYLDLLADQVEDTAQDLSTSRAENERLQGELRRTGAELQRVQGELRRVQAELDEYEQAGDRVNEQIVQLFSEAQLVAEEMVQDVSRDARERIGQARAHERRIVEEAMDTAGQQVRSYAQSAQLRMQSIVDSFGSEIEQLGGETAPGEPGRHQKDAWFDDMSDWQVRLRNERRPDAPGRA